MKEYDVSRIGKIRKTIGLTQKELAKLSGVSQSLIAKIESNKLDPAYSKVVAIFEALENETNKSKKTMIAKDMMNRKLYYVETKDRINKAVKLMKEKDISQLPVFEGNNPVGSVSDHMFMEWIEKYGHSLKNIKLSEVMGEGFPIIPENAKIEMISELLKYYKAVLVKKGNKITGIITRADLIKAMK